MDKWVKDLVFDLTNGEVSLTDSMLKVKVIAARIQSDRLRIWVNSELNGYSSIEVPSYREVPTVVQGTVVQIIGDKMLRRPGQTMPIEYLNKEVRDKIMSNRLAMGIGQLEEMLTPDGQHIVPLPQVVCQMLSERVPNGYIEACWQVIERSSVKGILTSIKSKLLDFVIELEPALEDKQVAEGDAQATVEKIFERTIGEVSGTVNTINCTFGDGSTQAINIGDHAAQAVSTNDDANIRYSDDERSRLQSFINEVSSAVEDMSLEEDDRDDLKLEIDRLQRQIQRESPRASVIDGALSTMHSILAGVTGNAYTPQLFESLRMLMG